MAGKQTHLKFLDSLESLLLPLTLWYFSKFFGAKSEFFKQGICTKCNISSPWSLSGSEAAFSTEVP